jgi:hypothetical protein
MMSIKNITYLLSMNTLISKLPHLFITRIIFFMKGS